MAPTSNPARPIHPENDQENDISKNDLLTAALTKRLLLQHHPNQRISKDALELTNEFIRMFIIEARERASIEAECEDQRQRTNDTEEDSPNISIRGDHIFKIGANLLMDFS